jgi:hypothetical protein
MDNSDPMCAPLSLEWLFSCRHGSASAENQPWIPRICDHNPAPSAAKPTNPAGHSNSHFGRARRRFFVFRAHDHARAQTKKSVAGPWKFNPASFEFPRIEVSFGSPFPDFWRVSFPPEDWSWRNERSRRSFPASLKKSGNGEKVAAADPSKDVHFAAVRRIQPQCQKSKKFGIVGGGDV